MTHRRNSATPSGPICTGLGNTDRWRNDFRLEWLAQDTTQMMDQDTDLDLLGCPSVSAAFCHFFTGTVCVTRMSEEQGDMMLASESQAGISVLAQQLFRAPPSAAFTASLCRSVFVKWEWLLQRLTRTTSTSRRTLVNGGETARVEGTKEWGDRKEEGGGCPEGKLTTSLGFALLVDCIRNTFLVRSAGGGDNQPLCVRRAHQGTFMRCVF